MIRLQSTNPLSYRRAFVFPFTWNTLTTYVVVIIIITITVILFYVHCVLPALMSVHQVFMWCPQRL